MLGKEGVSSLNWVNIDIIDNKCTANQMQNISDIIEEIFNKQMEVCIVDIDKSSYGKSTNEIDKYLKKYNEKLWIAGGIKSFEEAKLLIKKGAKGVVLGSTLYRDENLDDAFIEKFINDFDMSKVYFSLDYLEDNIVIKGFRKKTHIKLDDILKKINKKRSNVNVILVDVRASKNQTEVDFERILDIVKKYEYINFCYGGNIATWKQVAMLNNLGVGAVLGKNYLRGDFV